MAPSQVHNNVLRMKFKSKILKVFLMKSVLVKNTMLESRVSRKDSVLATMKNEKI